MPNIRMLLVGLSIPQPTMPLLLSSPPPFSPFHRTSCSTSASSPSSSSAYGFLPFVKSTTAPRLQFGRRKQRKDRQWRRARGSAGMGGLESDSLVLLENDDSLLRSYAKPRRIALFIEPSPFAYVSGYKNRYQNFIRCLRQMGDEVLVVTTHQGLPEEFHGAKLIGSWSFPFPWYKNVQLSLALSPRIISEVANFKPDVIHVTSPGIMVFGALLIAKLLSTPLVMSYHTHVPIYISRYTFSWLVKPMWLIIKFLHRLADLTLVPSSAIAQELQEARVTTPDKIRLWNKGVDSERFHPCYRSKEMRIRLSDGEPERPLIVHVGRLGAEKSLDFLKRVMDRLPEARIAIVGDGPYRVELEKMFAGTSSVFTGMLHGEELSQAYSSGDIFVMPSESETLGFVVLEAMSSGIPVVAARAGGIPEIIPADREGETGFMYTPGDLDDCVRKLEILLKNNELREAMGRKAREEIEKYTWLAASRMIRNEQYNAAIWFWQKTRAEVFNPVHWLTKWIPQSPTVDTEVSQT